MTNPNVLSQRYATEEINEIFSEKGRILAERDLWIAVLKAQKELGLDVPQKAIVAYEKARNDIDLDLIREIEVETEHDIVARIRAFNAAAGGHEQIHRGMTSRDLSDNVEQMQIKKAAKIIFGKYVSILRHFADKAREYDSIVLTARTHHQAAQPTLLGRRFSMWGEELCEHLASLEKFMVNYPLRGIKGPVGTQLDMLTLLGDKRKVAKLESKVAESLGFSRVLANTGQTYQRSLDYALASILASCASACENFAKGIRLMSGYELTTEGFKENQVGSSSMPHKMNTRTSERICGFSELLKMYADGLSRISGDQWEEGDVSDSVVRRTIIPDMFYASDGLCEATLTVLNQMKAYPEVIEAEVDRYLPFLATTELLSAAVKKGMGREEAHEIIRKCAVEEALSMRKTGSFKNKLAEVLAKNPKFPLRKPEIESILQDRAHFVGNAKDQISSFLEKAELLIGKFAADALYEPKPIL